MSTNDQYKYREIHPEWGITTVILSDRTIRTEYMPLIEMFIQTSRFHGKNGVTQTGRFKRKSSSY